MSKLVDRLKAFFKKHFFVLLLVLLVSSIAFLNYQPGTWLAGWDNLHPNLNFRANFERSFFSIWQEYRGLGLLDGMAHAANLLHTAFIFLLSFILPANFLRYFFHFLMWFLGGTGVYYFILNQSSLANSSTSGEFRQRWTTIRDVPLTRFAAFLGGLFCLLNIGTIQMFYAPLEVFSVHFAALPWLTLFLIRFLKSGLKKDLVWFFVLSLLFTLQSYVPTVFIVYFLSVLVILAFYYRVPSFSRKTIILLSLVFAVNAFWSLPYFYSVFNNAETITSSKINQMANEDIRLKNEVFGDFKSVALIHGFSLDHVDGLTYMMAPWREHLKKLPVEVISWAFFGLAILGIVETLINKKKNFYPFLVLFVISFLMLANDTPILSLPFNFFSAYIPFFAAAFRFGFTKFSILYVFCYSLFLVLGIEAIFNFFTNQSEQLKKVIGFLIGFIFACSLIFYSWPVFRGEFFYKNLQVEIPKIYFQLIDFFKKENKNSRIVILPQPSFWGWTYYGWGFRGSGFIWQGLPQASMDGAFLPWSRENENFYWQISYALYSQNLPLLESVLEKYQIGWLVVDENIIGSASSKAFLYTEKLEELLENSEKVKLTEVFSEDRQKKIKVYRVDLDSRQGNFVFLSKDLPQVGPEYKWNNEDTAFEKYGNYVSTTKKSTEADFGEFNVSKTSASQATSSVLQDATNDKYLEGLVPDQPGSTPVLVYQEERDFVNSSNIQVYYPFRSLFTGRRQEELEFGVEDKGDYFSFTTQIPKELAEQKLNISLEEQNELVFWDENLASSSAIPEVLLDGDLLFSSDKDRSPIPSPLGNPFGYPRGGPLAHSETNSEVSLALSTFKEGDLEVRVAKKKGYFTYDSEEDESLLAKPVESCDPFNKGVMTRRVTEENNKKLLRFTSLSSSNCLGIDLPQLTHKTGYLVKVESRNIKGKSLLFYVVNKNSKKAEIETYLPKSTTAGSVFNSSTPGESLRATPGVSLTHKASQVATSYFIIPPMEEYGQGYSLHFDNISIGRQETVNDLGRIEVYPIPYNFLKNLKISSFPSETELARSSEKVDFQVTHPNPSFYKVVLPTTYNLQPTTTLVLSQSYHPGWTAFSIGKEKLEIGNLKLEIPKINILGDHLLVNNWANGFKISNVKSQMSKPNLKTENEQAQNQNNLTTNYQLPTTIYIFFWPQILEYLGFGLLLGVGVWLLIKREFKI